jgi:hypothetical protein
MAVSVFPTSKLEDVSILSISLFSQRAFVNSLSSPAICSGSKTASKLAGFMALSLSQSAVILGKYHSSSTPMAAFVFLVGFDQNG